MFRADKIVVNLLKIGKLCLRDNGGVARDKLKAIDTATGEFGVSRDGGGLFGRGRSQADSITGPLGTQIVNFFRVVKENAYKRTDNNEVPTRSHIKDAIEGLKRMRDSYSSQAVKLQRLNEIIRNVESLFKIELIEVDYHYWGQRASDIARNTRLFKSSNKLYEQDLASEDNRSLTLPSPNIFNINGIDYTGMERRDIANSELNNLRVNYKGKRKKLADEAAKIGVGNCGELAMIAYQFLTLNNIHPIARFRLEPPGDHAFLALGNELNHIRDLSSSNQNLDLKKSKLKKDFNDWPTKVYICDPWANIFCKAAEYPLKFQQQMFWWTANGKLVRYNRKWIHPTDLNYNLSVAQYDKKCTHAKL